jgi:hypothetical protein
VNTQRKSIVRTGRSGNLYDRLEEARARRSEVLAHIDAAQKTRLDQSLPPCSNEVPEPFRFKRLFFMCGALLIGILTIMLSASSNDGIAVVAGPLVAVDLSEAGSTLSR